MIIEYTDTAIKTEQVGKDWKAYLYDRKRNTNIVYELWDVIENNLNTDFENLGIMIREAYKTRKSKCKIEIYRSENNIELTNKEVFPNILILKDENRKR